MDSRENTIAMDTTNVQALAMKTQLMQMSNGANGTVLPTPEITGDTFVRSYRDMERELRQTASTVLTNLKTGKKYKRVHVLSVYWEKGISDRQHIPDFARRLLDTLHKGYGYIPEELPLGSEEAKAELNDKLSELKTTLGSKTEENLFVLHYSGHGHIDRHDSTKRYWMAKKDSLLKSATSIDWYKAQSRLEDFDCDILFLFDCCHAMGMPDEELEWRKRCEIIGACQAREMAGGTVATSFTSELIALLNGDLHDGGTSAWRLGTHLKSLDYKTKLKSTPDYKLLARGHPTIPLVPLPPGNTQPGSNGASTASSSTAASILTPTPRIMFCFHVDGPVDAKHFDRMLKCMPQSVSNVQFAVQDARVVDSTGLYESNSALAFLSVPVWFWCAMTPRSDYKFIGLVRSGDLLEEYRRKEGEIAAELNLTQDQQRKEIEESRAPGLSTFIQIGGNHPGVAKSELIDASNRFSRSRADQKQIQVSWNAPRKRIFSMPGNQITYDIKKDTAKLSTNQIKDDLGKYDSMFVYRPRKGIPVG